MDTEALCAMGSRDQVDLTVRRPEHGAEHGAERDREAGDPAGNPMVRIVLDGDGRICWANPNAVRLLRLSPSSSRRLEDLLHPDDRAVLRQLADGQRDADGATCLLRTRPGPENGASRYLHTVVHSAAVPRGRPGPGLLLQGWDVTELALHNKALMAHEFRDPLTGLANRLTLLARLDHELTRSRRSGTLVSLLCLDIDGFAEVNGRCGQEGGDRLLVRLARRLEQSLRPADTLARIHGDQFAVICSDLTHRHDAMAVADRLREAAGEPVAIGGPDDTRIQVSVSIGVAFSQESDLSDAGHGLLGRAGAKLRLEHGHRRSPVLLARPGDPGRSPTAT